MVRVWRLGSGGWGLVVRIYWLGFSGYDLVFRVYRLWGLGSEYGR